MLRLPYQGRAQAAAGLGQYSKAMPDLDRSVELSTGLDRAQSRLQRARVWALAGDLSRATAKAEAVPGEHKTRAQLLFFAARVYAFASRKVQDGRNQSTSERVLYPEQNAGRAMELRGRVKAVSGFKYAGLQTQLRQEEHFNPLRAREGFRKLVGSLAVAEQNNQ
jgi:hypothetical protein